MRYWKKSTGSCGTIYDDGYVPNSVEIEKSEYDAYVNSIPIIMQPDEIIEYEDMETGKIHVFKKIKSYTQPRIINEPLFGDELEEWRTNNLS